MFLFGTYDFLYERHSFIFLIKDKIFASFLNTQENIINLFSRYSFYFKSQNELRMMLQALQEKCEDLQGRIIELEVEHLFIHETEELVEFRKKYTIENAQISKIFFKRMDDVEHSFYIDSGFDQGVRIDSAVVFKNCLIGRVVQVYSNYSKVMFITDKNCRISVVGVSTKTPGIWEGMCTKNGLLRHVDHLQQLQIGDVLVSNGEGLIYPYGFAVGKINSFERTSVEYTIAVEPLIDFSQLQYCYIIPAKNIIHKGLCE